LRTLIVDDFEKFRGYLCSVLEKDSRFTIVGQASDGVEAVVKAAALKPDLILLDVGLPRLNGLEVARRIRKLALLAKILFISQEFSFEIVEAALRAGAQGYVHKLHVSRELMPAIEAVSRERYFISGVLKQQFGEAKSQARHEVQFYADDAVLVEGCANFITAELAAGKAAIILATESHRTGVFQRLHTKKVDVDHAIAAGTLISLDAVETLSTLMSDQMPDPNLFFDVIGGLIEKITKAAPRVAVCGEICPHLLAAGMIIQAIRLEQLWDLMVHRFSLDTLCAYSLAQVEKDSDAFRSICAEHSAIYCG
jgi:DNA-binding NarL/FixJ family response regulator